MIKWIRSKIDFFINHIDWQQVKREVIGGGCLLILMGLIGTCTHRMNSDKAERTTNRVILKVSEECEKHGRYISPDGSLIIKCSVFRK